MRRSTLRNNFRRWYEFKEAGNERHINAMLRKFWDKQDKKKLVIGFRKITVWAGQWRDVRKKDNFLAWVKWAKDRVAEKLWLERKLIELTIPKTAFEGWREFAKTERLIREATLLAVRMRKRRGLWDFLKATRESRRASMRKQMRAREACELTKLQIWERHMGIVFEWCPVKLGWGRYRHTRGALVVAAFSKLPLADVDGSAKRSGKVRLGHVLIAVNGVPVPNRCRYRAHECVKGQSLPRNLELVYNHKVHDRWLARRFGHANYQVSDAKAEQAFARREARRAREDDAAANRAQQKARRRDLQWAAKDARDAKACCDKNAPALAAKALAIREDLERLEAELEALENFVEPTEEEIARKEAEEEAKKAAERPPPPLEGARWERFLTKLEGKGFFDGAEKGTPAYVLRYADAGKRYQAQAAFPGRRQKKDLGPIHRSEVVLLSL